MRILFLGSTACMTDVGDDSPCFLINDKYLFDCGWNAVEGLRSCGGDLSKLHYLFFTHMHQDHYLGLAGLLFYIANQQNMDGQLSMEQLTVFGPKQDVERVVDLACSFIQLDRFYPNIKKPKVVPVSAGDCLQLEDMTIMTSRSLHPVEALSYRLVDGEGRKLGITGDTAYQSCAADFFAGCDGVIHDAAMALYKEAEPPAERKYGHSTLLEAVKTAEDAGIQILFPMHMTADVCHESVKKLQPDTKVTIVPVKRGSYYEL